MSIPYEQLCSTENDIPRSPYMRLPSYQSLRHRRYHPYTTTRTRLLSSSSDTEPDTDFEAEMLLAHAGQIPGPLSLTTILEDDCMAGLRTVLSQMSGGDSAYMRLGSVHLVIDFALVVRRHLRSAA